MKSKTSALRAAVVAMALTAIPSYAGAAPAKEPASTAPAPSRLRVLLLAAPRPSQYTRNKEGFVTQAETPPNEVPPSRLYTGSGKSFKPIDLPTNRVSAIAPFGSVKGAGVDLCLRTSKADEKGKPGFVYSPVASVDKAAASRGALLCLFRKAENEPILPPASLTIPIDSESLPPGAIVVLNTAAAPVVGMVGGTQLALAPGSFKVLTPKLVDGNLQIRLAMPGRQSGEFIPLANTERPMQSDRNAIVATFVADRRMRPIGMDWVFDSWENPPPTPAKLASAPSK